MDLRRVISSRPFRRAALVQISVHAVRDDDKVHIPGESISGLETLCGYCDTLTNWDQAKGPVTCAACLKIWEHAHTFSKKDVLG